MRTKALLLTAALGVAGAATSMAQVYSVNAVGYVNVTFTGPGKLTLFANPLVQANTQIGSLIPIGTPGVPDGTIYYKFVNGNLNINTYDLSGIGDWEVPGETIDLGGAGFILNPGAPFTLTFVGEVATGTQNVTVNPGYNGISSKIPQAGLVETDLLLPANDGQILYKWNIGTQNYDFFTDDISGTGGWDPTEPSIGVAEGFLLLRGVGQGGTWTRTFSL